MTYIGILTRLKVCQVEIWNIRVFATDVEWITGGYHVKPYMTHVGTVAEKVTGPVFVRQYPKARKTTKIHSLIGLKTSDSIRILIKATRVAQANILGDIRVCRVRQAKISNKTRILELTKILEINSTAKIPSKVPTVRISNKI